MKLQQGNTTYVFILILIIVASILLAGGFRKYNIHFLTVPADGQITIPNSTVDTGATP